MVNYVIGDFISNLNIAKSQHLISINIRNTRINKQLLDIFLNLGVIRDINIENDLIEVYMNYLKSKSIFKRIKLISTPGRRRYITLLNLVKLKDRSSTSVYILSTSKGLKTDYECIVHKLSGEIILKIEF